MTETTKNRFCEPMSEGSLFARTWLSTCVFLQSPLLFSFPNSFNPSFMGLGRPNYLYGWVKIMGEVTTFLLN